MIRKKILIAGGSGLIGSRLIDMLDDKMYEIFVLSRSKQNDTGKVKYILWDPAAHTSDLIFTKDIDVVINLAGAGIADKRWTDDRKKIILESRLNSTKTLAKSLVDAGIKTDVYIGASAIGYYGDRKDEILTEDSMPGEGFLPNVCEEWEKAHGLISDLTNRQVILRIGIVLSYNGGALKEILKPTRAGMYAYFGKGDTYYSWIHIDDLCMLMLKAIEDNAYSGIYNATAPKPETIESFMSTLKKVKSGILPLISMPSLFIKIILGKMAAVLLDSTRAIPKKLLDQKHQFAYKDIEMAFRDILSRKI